MNNGTMAKWSGQGERKRERRDKQSLCHHTIRGLWKNVVSYEVPAESNEQRGQLDLRPQEEDWQMEKKNNGMQHASRAWSTCPASSLH